LSSDFDDIVAWLWEDDRSQVAARLINLAEAGVIDQQPKLVLRELMSMANCHSKSKMPIGVLNDPHRLRQTMQTVAAADLRVLYHRQQANKVRRALPTPRPMHNINEIERLATSR
jgi:hypothetical protein